MIKAFERFKVSIFEGQIETVVEIDKPKEIRHVRAINLNCLAINSDWLRINKKRNKCYCCETEFKRKDIASVLMTDKGNIVACENCASYVNDMFNSIK